MEFVAGKHFDIMGLEGGGSPKQLILKLELIRKVLGGAPTAFPEVGADRFSHS
jgi:hypothetical protein